MMSEHVELNEETRARLDKYVEERGAFPLHLTCESVDDLVNGLLDTIERLEYKCERIETHADIERDVLFDAVLIAMQRNEDLQTVTEIKERLVYYVNIAFNRTGNFDEVDFDIRRLYALAEEHNKVRRYDNGVFQWRR